MTADTAPPIVVGRRRSSPVIKKQSHPDRKEPIMNKGIIAAVAVAIIAIIGVAVNKFRL